MALRTTKVFNGPLARELREERNLTVDELADQIGWHPDTLRNVELGHKQPSLKLSHAWARALEIPRAELMTDAPQAEAEPA